LNGARTGAYNPGITEGGEGHEVSGVERLERRLDVRLGRAIGDFDLIRPGDRILVGVSGGKDSWVLLHLLRRLQRRAPVAFDLLAVSIDQGFPGFRADVIEDYLAREGYTYEMRHARIGLTVREKLAPGETFCSLCARLRRGTLYRLADELGCGTIALGHHADDCIETLLLNQFFNGRLRGMPARLAARNGRHVVIRPLVYLWEEEIAEYARALGVPVVCCGCPGCLDPTLERHRVKRLLRELERAHPGLKRSLLASLGRVDPPSLLLAPGGRSGRDAASPKVALAAAGVPEDGDGE
jgi:tRNA 2-thiocytidine biosynthesis protein TtcA